MKKYQHLISVIGNFILPIKAIVYKIKIFRKGEKQASYNLEYNILLLSTYTIYVLSSGMTFWPSFLGISYLLNTHFYFSFIL